MISFKEHPSTPADAVACFEDGECLYEYHTGQSQYNTLIRDVFSVRYNLPDNAQAVLLGQKILSSVRKYLWRGPFNNIVSPHHLINHVKRPHLLRSIHDSLHSYLYENIITDANGTMGKISENPSFNNLSLMASKAEITGQLGGGVCSDFAALTAALVTREGIEDTKIAIISSPYKHEFCLIKYKKSNWYVLDSWVGKSYVIHANDSNWFYGSKRNKYQANQAIMSSILIKIRKKSRDKIKSMFQLSEKGSIYTQLNAMQQHDMRKFFIDLNKKEHLYREYVGNRDYFSGDISCQPSNLREGLLRPLSDGFEYPYLDNSNTGANLFNLIDDLKVSNTVSNMVKKCMF